MTEGVTVPGPNEGRGSQKKKRKEGPLNSNKGGERSLNRLSGQGRISRWEINRKKKVKLATIFCWDQKWGKKREVSHESTRKRDPKRDPEVMERFRDVETQYQKKGRYLRSINIRRIVLIEESLFFRPDATS